MQCIYKQYYDCSKYLAYPFGADKQTDRYGFMCQNWHPFYRNIVLKVKTEEVTKISGYNNTVLKHTRNNPNRNVWNIFLEVRIVPAAKKF